MTPADLAAVEARLNAIPDLPLVVCAGAGSGRPHKRSIWMNDHGDGRFVGETNDLRGAYSALFASAPTDLRALLAHVRALEAERDEARRLLGECARISGADLSGYDDPAQAWERAVEDVRALRAEADDATTWEVERLTRAADGRREHHAVEDLGDVELPAEDAARVERAVERAEHDLSQDRARAAETRHVTCAWAAFRARCEEADITPEAFPRMVLHRDGSGHVENTWVGPGRRTRLKLGTLFEGTFFREDDHRPETWVRTTPEREIE